MASWGPAEIGVVLNSAAVALGVGYGFWLKSVVDIQVKAKDATIESLKTQIDDLSKKTATALAAHVKTLEESLELMAKALQEERAKYEGELAAMTSLERGNMEIAKLERTNDYLFNRVLTMSGELDGLRRVGTGLAKLHGSFKKGTVVKPADDFDIDLGIFIDKKESPKGEK
jgi:cell division protein FtsB